MPAGTLTLTNNSAVVKGTGTAFNTELKAGDFIVSVVGGVTYTLPVKTVDSATQATLIKVYDGPTQTGAAWYAVPRDAMNTITAQLAAETAKAMRGMNYDKTNWQKFFTADDDVTITLPDNSQSTGPSAKKLMKRLDDISAYNIGADIAVMKIGEIIQIDWLAIAAAPIGNYNPVTVGGVTYYTHFYKFMLPVEMPTGIISCFAQVVGSPFGSQGAETNVDVKVRRDNDAGNSPSKSFVTISVKTPKTGWTPAFSLRVTGH